MRLQKHQKCDCILNAPDRGPEMQSHFFAIRTQIAFILQFKRIFFCISNAFFWRSDAFFATRAQIAFFLRLGRKSHFFCDCQGPSVEFAFLFAFSCLLACVFFGIFNYLIEDRLCLTHTVSRIDETDSKLDN